MFITSWKTVLNTFAVVLIEPSVTVHEHFHVPPFLFSGGHTTAIVNPYMGLSCEETI